MSSLWTPSGEQPVGRGGAGAPAEDAEPTEEELAAHLDEVRRQLADTPAAVVVANHAMGLFELAALHLSMQPPNLAEAKVAIDAMAALVRSIEGMLGPDEATVNDALAQLRLAFVQLQAASPAAPPPADAGSPTEA